MTSEDRNQSGAPKTDVSPDEEATELAASDAPILGSQEAADAETVVVTSEDPAEAATEYVAHDAETVVVGAEGESDSEHGNEAPTEVMESADAATLASGIGAVAAQTELVGGKVPTRVLPDKTSPPPVNTPLRGGGGAAASTPIDPDRGLPPGMILFGEYEIVNVLGVGGMGEVYRARHRRLDEHRAIKVMHADLATKKGASEFFYREAKALLAVRHPAVVHCHDLLSDDEGRVYLIMEMIEGIPLSKKMNDGPLTSDEVAILGARVAHGLSAAHRKGVIHRDLSPDNIVLPNGRVQEAKIIDFGIAKLLQDGEGTIIDGFKGKLSYASPEQLGFFGGKIDGRSDFYSLGLVLAAASLGRPMSMGTSVVEAVDARRAFNTLPDGIPIGLRSSIEPLLALDPKDRPEYVDRLFVGPGGLDFSAEEGMVSSASGAVGSRAGTASGTRSTGLYAGIAAATALLIGGGAYFASSLDGGSGSESISPSSLAATPSANTAGVGEVPNAQAGQPQASPARETASAPVQAVTPPAPVVEAPKKPPVRRLNAQDRFRIIGLISNAKLALSENRLMSPADDNAYDRYRRVLALDPSDVRAQRGLSEIARRYVGMAESALGESDLDRARGFVKRARQADPELPALSAIEARLSR